METRPAPVLYAQLQVASNRTAQPLFGSRYCCSAIRKSNWPLLTVSGGVPSAM